MSSENKTVTLENLVKCAICLDTMTDPRCLPCSHTYCYQCIEHLCQEGIGQCPMRDNTIFFRHTIDKLPVNRIAKDLIECLKQSSITELKCDHCEEMTAEFVCQTCSKSFCTLCLKEQHHLNQFQTHQIHLILKQNRDPFCSKHTDEKRKYWCQQCEQLVCSDCLLFEHQTHSFIKLTEIAEKTKIELQSSMKMLVQMKENLQVLHKKIHDAHRTHYQIHSQTKRAIEQTFDDLHNLLEERKNSLIQQLTERNAVQQRLLQGEKILLEEQLKEIWIREDFLRQLLHLDEHVQLIDMKKDFLHYHQLIQQEYQQLMQGCIIDHQHFSLDQHLTTIEQQLEDFGRITTETCFLDHDRTSTIVKLFPSEGEEKIQDFEGVYAYGYKFDLIQPLKIYRIRVRVALFNQDLTAYIFNHHDRLIAEQSIEKNNDLNSSTLQWRIIPVNCQMEQNYSLFLWTKPSDNSIPIIGSKDSNHRLREINQHISVRSKRAQIISSNPIDDQPPQFEILYDALLNNDEQNEKILPAIEMILEL